MPVRLVKDDRVVGVVSGRYNSADGWFRDTTLVARTEQLMDLFAGAGLDAPLAQPPDTHEVTLMTEEQLALGLVLSDPMAVERGAWLYPLHQQLTRRGFSDAMATVVLGRLAYRGILEPVLVPSQDSGHDGAPAYKVTEHGLNVAASYEDVLSYNEKYSYLLTLKGGRRANNPFLDRLQRLPKVERQTRFITEDQKGTSKIAAWSYERIDQLIADIAKQEDAVILDLRMT